MEEQDLILIVAPLMGHILPSLEMAKILLERHKKLSITVFLIEIPIDPEGTKAIKSLATSSATKNLRFIYLPTPADTSHWSWTNRPEFVNQMVEYSKPNVREVVKNIKYLSGFIVDMVTPTMIDIADEFGVPSYLFFTSPASFLGLWLYFQMLEDEKNFSVPDEFHGITEMDIPCFTKPLPASVFPFITTNKHLWSSRFLHFARKYRRAKAILINTFTDLEDYSLKSFTNGSAYGKVKVPPIYSVGPILTTQNVASSKNHSSTAAWLDEQPESSVVFLCFGSLGCFPIDQIKEIAKGLELSGHRFLWSLRQSSTNHGGFPKEYENHSDVLPEGFLNRTSKIGKVVGWTQQIDVLSHRTVGGFVSHCGWNSILESIWCGVPIATWPISGEQQINAFKLVEELEIGVKISLDYAQTKEDQPLVSAEEIENGLKRLMDGENEARKKIKELSQKSRIAVSKGGTSFLALENFIHNLIVGCNSGHE